MKILLAISLLIVSFTSSAVSTETSYCGELQGVHTNPWRVLVSERNLYLPTQTTQDNLHRLQSLRGQTVCFEVKEREGKTWAVQVLEKRNR